MRSRVQHSGRLSLEGFCRVAVLHAPAYSCVIVTRQPLACADRYFVDRRWSTRHHILALGFHTAQLACGCFPHSRAL